jgi:hypothetical protein
MWSTCTIILIFFKNVFVELLSERLVQSWSFSCHSGTSNLVSSFQNWLILDPNNKNVKETIRQTEERKKNNEKTNKTNRNKTFNKKPNNDINSKMKDIINFKMCYYKIIWNIIVIIISMADMCWASHSSAHPICMVCLQKGYKHELSKMSFVGKHQNLLGLYNVFNLGYYL